MRLLFITSTRVGDAVLSTGLLDHLVRSHPGLRVTVVCGAPAAPLFEAVPGLVQLVPLHKQPLSLHWLAVWANSVAFLWDFVVDLRNTPMTALLFARKRWRSGRPDESVHRLVHLARVMGLEGDPPAPRLWIADAHRRRAAQLVPDGPPILGVGPTANWIGKTWPAERFAALVERLTGAGGVLPGARVALFGQADERYAAMPVIEAVPAHRRIDLVGAVSVLEAYACLRHAAFYVGNDSGLMHIAAAAGVPTLGLFGPSREEHYAPWGAMAATVRPPIAYDDMFPADFDHRTTGTLMGGLTVDRVEAAARALWRRVQEAA